MRAFVITGPGSAEVVGVPEPRADAGHVVVDVRRAGVCGTDVELFAGTMPYLHDGSASYPLVPSTIGRASSWWIRPIRWVKLAPSGSR